MCFPVLACLVDWLPRREHDAKVEGNHSVQFVKLRYLPLFIMAAVTAAVAAYSQTHVAGQDSTALYAVPLSHRIVNAFSAIGYYIRATFWPFGLHVDCRAVSSLWPIGAGWNLLALAVADVAIGIAVVRCRRHSAAGNRRPTTDNPTLSSVSCHLSSNIGFSVSWFLVSLLPTLGLFGSFGIEAHADRFAYLPLMALSFLLAGFGSWAANAKPRNEPNTQTADTKLPAINHQLPTINYQLPTFIVIVLLSLVTFQQLSHWRDDWAAHERALACDPEHPRAMVHVADARCSRKRDFDGGIRLYRKALSPAGMVPVGGFNIADVKARLAYALASRGGYDDFAEVKKLGAEVLQDFRLDRRGMMLDALGTAFMAEGDSNRATLLFKASIEAPDRFWPKASTRRKLERCK